MERCRCEPASACSAAYRRVNVAGRWRVMGPTDPQGAKAGKVSQSLDLALAARFPAEHVHERARRQDALGMRRTWMLARPTPGSQPRPTTARCRSADVAGAAFRYAREASRFE